MKALAMLPLVILLPFVSAAQNPAISPDPPDIKIVKFSWARERLNWDSDPFRNSGESYEEMRDRMYDERLLQNARDKKDKIAAERIQSVARTRQEIATNARQQQTRPPRDGYKYKVVVENTGARTIKLIDWDYVFSDPETKSEIARHQFTSEEKIRPGKNKELDVLILSAPTKTVSAAVLRRKEQSPFDEQVILVRIEYTDGSVWQRP